MALRTRPVQFPVHTAVNSAQIMRTSKMVSSFTGMMVQPNKAIVGGNAFAHEAGIHQDGVLKHQATYEIMTPESVGLVTNNLVLGKHSGRHAYRKRLETLGYTEISDEQLDLFFGMFKKLADEKKEVTDADIETIVSNTLAEPENFWSLGSIYVTAGDRIKPTATVTLHHKDGQEISEAAIGIGPVDALFTAISRIVRAPNSLVEYTIKSITEGETSLGEVLCRIQPQDSMVDQSPDMTYNAQTGSSRVRQFSGHGASQDILVASAQGYIVALNRMLAHQKEQKRAADRLSSLTAGAPATAATTPSQ